MADTPFFSSQTSLYEQHQILPNQENRDPDSSPLKGRESHASKPHGGKAKALPTVTPKRFNKFFTPRSSASTRGGSRQSKSGRQLRDITKNGANRKRGPRPLEQPQLRKNEEQSHTRPPKRRKISIDISSSPPRSSPLKHVQPTEQPEIHDMEPSSPLGTDDEILSDLMDDLEPFPKPIRRLRRTAHAQRILERSFGGNHAHGRGLRGSEHCADWRAETANFVSTPKDMHRFVTRDTLPFCTASCHTNSMIAIGEEEGSLRLMDSSPFSDFSQAHVHFRPHHNAVMDITFSSDDHLLATASGDQTSRIIDMHTQQTICILSGHKSSVKQVKFQQNDNNMLTTSARDGSVQIWDMRCGSTGSVQSLRTAFARNVDNGEREPTVRYSKYSIDVGSAFRKAALSNPPEMNDLSVTAIQHLPGDRQHLLLTTSEANSSVKLWDLRNASRRSQAVPLSSIAAPGSHAKARNFAINAMELSGDGARLYAVCRDNTIYAYATDSLVLGHAPEMSSSAGKGRLLKEPKTGLGPLYGLRHPSLKLGTFYIKASMRKAQGDNTEILAVGSSENCAILFPTDERHLPSRRLQHAQYPEDAEDDSDLPTLAKMTVAPNNESAIPIYHHGTALVRGHTKEVTAPCWTHNGDLVSIGDDSIARCWREDAEAARQLRLGGESGGRRWGSGWAELPREWDEEE